MDVNVKVAVRCRPMSSKEIARGCSSIIDIMGSSLVVKPVEGAASMEDKRFTFDFVYGQDSTQTEVYSALGKPMVAQALEGFNGTIFAYGQTGSGKTFSMMGNDTHKGIIPQLNEDLWVMLREKLRQSGAVDSDDKVQAKSLVRVSFLEVYNEDIKDLLKPSDKKLKIKESPDEGIYVEDLALLEVCDASEVMRRIYEGNAVRHVAATKMNDESSRSHSVFTIMIEQKVTTELAGNRTREQTIKAKLNLVDLAGSERASKTQASGATLKEGANINKSLMTLGNVINKLAEGLHDRHGNKRVIPYRESKLTRLLQESLGGNSATLMIAAISPADYNYSETLSTLKYANRAKSIENAVIKNEDMSEKMIRDLQAQIEELKQKLLAGNNNGNTGEIGSSDPELIEKLRQMEREQQDSWEEKQRLSRQLELEREKNVMDAIVQMKQSAKDQKLQHMKNVKRLNSEKNHLQTMLTSLKNEMSVLKKQIKENREKYVELQTEFDVHQKKLALDPLNGIPDEELTPQQLEERNARHLEWEKGSDEIGNKMVPLLTLLEQDMPLFEEKRLSMDRLKKRLEKVEVELNEERAELVVTAGILQQDDKMREEIENEMRDKLQIEMREKMDQEVEKMKEKLEEDRNAATSELEKQLVKARNDAEMARSLLKMEQRKTENAIEREKELQKYSDSLESRLTDAEISQETTQEELKKLKNLLIERDEEIMKLKEILLERELELKTSYNSQEILKEKLLEYTEKNEKLMKQYEIEHQHIGKNKIDYHELEEAKYAIFHSCMESFQTERKESQERYLHSQRMLAQATRDLMHLAARNQSLEEQLAQAVLYEPPIL